MAWLTGWSYRAPVTIDKTKVGSGGVTDFPAKLTGGTSALARSGDTYYTDANGRVQVALVRGSVVKLIVGIGTPTVARERKALTVTVPAAASYDLSTA